MQHQTVPQTREIPANEMAVGMTVIDGTDGPLAVTAVDRSADSLLVSFEGVPEPTLYGRGVTVYILAEQTPAAVEPAKQDWYFTFGSGQQHDGRYVQIPGTYDTARDEMLRHFGNAWSFQYASAERAGVEEFGLVELPRSEWPPTDDEIAEEIDQAFAEASEPAEPDYWLTLADAIRQHADRIATLAGTELKPSYVGLSIQVAGPGNTDPVAGDTVDVIANAFGLTAETGRTVTGQYHERKASAKLDALNFTVYTYLPETEDPEKTAMRAELEQLRAQLAEGGAR